MNLERPVVNSIPSVDNAKPIDHAAAVKKMEVKDMLEGSIANDTPSTEPKNLQSVGGQLPQVPSDLSEG